MQAYINERAAPELLEYQGDLLARLQDQIHNQVWCLLPASYAGRTHMEFGSYMLAGEQILPTSHYISHAGSPAQRPCKPKHFLHLMGEVAARAERLQEILP